MRTTRAVKLTAEGELYWKECHLALEQIAEAERAITGSQTVPSGPLRISVSAAYGTFRLLPLMPKFTELYPQIDIEISISDKIIDFVEEGFDLAIRLGVLQDSRLVAFKLEDASLGVFGTPTYLAKKVNHTVLMTSINTIASSTYHRIQGAHCSGCSPMSQVLQSRNR
ncbi:LysR substrate-binding domain-containing protein [Candidatus Pantoea bituminis]|uniref:LysR substrate-binding domain-containing protein n=1 Tax=Candidatus Pantoea bituminis TaxID=2831036 RepID=UPI00208E01D1|nr:LysR substrate-binding domain-containing protein [Pantoea bituminis]